MTVAFAMLADYAVSMTVTPVVLARLYTRGHGDGVSGGKLGCRGLVPLRPGGI